MAATAVEGLSLEPPSLLICVNRSASLALPLARGADFCVNLLGLSHHALPARCSSPNRGEERFTAGEWSETDCGLPRLADAPVSFLCGYERHIEYGTHLVVIGRIREVAITGPVEPLVHADGDYHRLERLRH